MDVQKEITMALQSAADPQKAAGQLRFFKTNTGEYGAGDQLLGVAVPRLRTISNEFWKKASFDNLTALLGEKTHEYRMVALFILVLQYQKSKNPDKHGQIARFYLDHLDGVNNWDLVDSSAHYILGPWLLEHPEERSVLERLAISGDLWRERVSVMTTFAFIKAGEYNPTLHLAERFLGHPHDLIHKAIGWMLREIGNRDLKTEEAFLKQHYRSMPRTMLRYAIEKFPENLRQAYLQGKID